MASVKVKPETGEVVKTRTQTKSDPKKIKKHLPVTLPQVAHILDELAQDFTPQNIATRYPVSTQYVKRIYTYYRELVKTDREAHSLDVSAIKSRAEDGFIRMVDRVQRSITSGDIFRASLKDKVWAIGVLYDKHRLATGQSTSNVKTLAMIVERMDQGRRYPGAAGPKPEPIPADVTIKDAAPVGNPEAVI